MCVLERVEIIHKSKFLPGTVEKNSSTIGPPAGIEPTPVLEVKCRKIIMIYPQRMISHVIDVLFLILKNTMGRNDTSRTWSITKQALCTV